MPLERVAYFEQAPTDRKFKVIGYVAPPPEAFHTFPEFANAIRAAGALHGADAVFIDSQKESSRWEFGVFGGSNRRELNVRGKAIVWEK